MIDRCEKYVREPRHQTHTYRCTRRGTKWVIAADVKAWLCTQHANVWHDLGENSYGGRMSAWLGVKR